MNPYKDVEENFSVEQHLSYADIATKLLKDQYFLTALELHTELVENGKELPQLREFFSNPGNFEQHVSRASDFGAIHRTPSQATLDSLDITRYSEDGGGDRAGSGGDVAVLEFELRKAKETINSLRANLTQFADGDSALDKNVKDNTQRSLKPHEKKALNFLINEYLLLQDYKLTSITFSDENPDQEFEDWDDVGLNMPRPPGLVSLFWGNTSSSVPKIDVATEVDLYVYDTQCQTDVDNNICVSCHGSLDHDADWNHELLIQAEEIELLKQKIVALETEKLNFQKLYDAAIVSLNSLTSPTSESKGLELQISDEKMIRSQQNDRPLMLTAMENHYGSGQSTHSATPEQFEMIESDKNNVMTGKLSSNTSSIDPTRENSVRNSPLHQGSITTLDETLSINDNGDWTRLHDDYTVVDSSKEMWIESPMPTTLKESLLNWCSEIVSANEPQSNDLLLELVNSEKPITLPGFLKLVVDTMPRIIPHTLVARRIEFVAVLAAAVALLPAGDSRRARTLNALVTLVKKPERSDTVAICEAASLIVKWGGGGELLSAIAELLASKSSERRILASQICVYVAPYVTLELCTSLLFSVVTLMCESSESEIRNCGLKAACLICPVADNKYGQLKNMMFSFLKDPNDKVVKETVNCFAPILARSALIAGNFSTDLFKQILSNFQRACSSEDWKTVLLYINILQALVLVNVAYVVNVQIVKDYSENCDTQIINLDEVSLRSERDSFMNLNCYISDNVDVRSLILSVNNVLKQEPQVRWSELNWFMEVLKQILQQASSSKLLNHPTVYENLISLFSSYVRNFGTEFSMQILKPIFMETIIDLEQKMEKLHSVNVESTIVVGIYLVTILPVHEDMSVRDEFYQKWIVYSSIRSLPVKIFSIPLKWVSSNSCDTLEFYLQHLREFAATSCESATGSTIRIYIASLLTELLNLADVSEQCIVKQVLPAVIALLHDDDVTVRESALSTWGSLTRSVVLRKLDCIEQCYNALEGILKEGMSGKEGARAAESLAIILLSLEGQSGGERAVMLVCQLCGLVSLSGEFVAAMSRALQLAHRSAPQCPALLPAVTKLEEAVQTPSLSHFKPTIDALLHSITGTQDQPRLDSTPRSNTNLQTAQEVGRRVTQIFQQSKTNMNLQNIFKKKYKNLFYSVIALIVKDVCGVATKTLENMVMPENEAI